MATLLRLLTRRKKSNKRDYVDSEMQTRVKDTDLECKIVHLDGTDFTFFLEKRALGQKLEDYTFHQIEVNDDKNYFGLQYTDKKNINHWLDIGKKVRKQLEIGPPYTLRFRVKFFSSDPCSQLHDEYTRYLFVQQLKLLLRSGELRCEDNDVAADIAALSLQGELGDYDEMEHSPAFISQFRFFPESQQTEELELLIISKYNLLKDRNILPSTADKQFLEKCRILPDYGVDQHNIKGKNDKDYILGLTPSGILIYEGHLKIGLFPWNNVTKLSFKKSRFKIVVQDVQPDDNGDVEHTFVFQSFDIVACKQMWKSCVEHHAFYRLEGVRKPPTKFQQIFRLKSRFYASFHTEYQMAVKSTFGTSTRRNSTFTRAPSLRLAPRASFERNEVERRKVQQRNRERVREENKNAAVQKINSVGQPISGASTPSSAGVENSYRPLSSPTKVNISANMQQRNTPRSLGPSSIVVSHVFRKQVSEESTSSESSESIVAKPPVKPKPVNIPPVHKPINARPNLNNGNQRNPPPPVSKRTPNVNHSPPVPQQRNARPITSKQSFNPRNSNNEQIIQV